jgi:hypothetical protein
MSDDRWLRNLPAPANKSMLWEWLGTFALLFLIVELGLTLFMLQHDRAATPSVPTQVERRIQHDSLRLRADRSGKQCKVSWDTNTAPLIDATTVTLVVEDGPQRTEQSLSTAQIQTGYATYPARTNDVLFQLEAVDKDGNRTSGSVRIIQVRRVSKSTQAQENTRTRRNESQPAEGAADRSQPVAGPVILNYDESAPAPKDSIKPESTHEPAPSSEPALNDHAPAGPQVSLQTRPNSADSSLTPAVVLKRLWGVFPKVGRKIGRIFGIGKPKSTP